MGEKIEETKIIKRKHPSIKKHRATVYMLLGNANDYLKRGGYTPTDKLLVIKTDNEYTGREWARFILACQRELEKMTGERVVRKY